MTQRLLFRVPREKHLALSHGLSDTTDRSYTWLKRQRDEKGKLLYHVAKAERTDVMPSKARDGKYTFLRCRDLFGFIDLLYLDPPRLVAVQSCMSHEVQAHLGKFRDHRPTAAAIREWLGIPGCAFVIHAWQCVETKERNGRYKKKWTKKDVDVTLKDLEEERF